jgi:hypothetical protein
MGRRSIYEFEKSGVVSIWVIRLPLSEIPRDYFEAHYGGDDDEPFNQFAEDFGFGYYDVDFAESNSVSGEPKTLERLLGECSFSRRTCARPSLRRSARDSRTRRPCSCSSTSSIGRG